MRAVAVGLALLVITNSASSQQADSPPASDPGPDVLYPANCMITAVEPDGVLVASRVRGFIESLEVDRGDEVLEDQTVGQLDDRYAQLELRIRQHRAENEVNLRYTNAAHAVAEADLDALESANQRQPGAVPEIDVRRRRLERDKAFWSIRQAEHDRALEQLELERAQYQLDDHSLRSPVTGIVLDVLRHPGEPVDQNEPVLRVLRTDRFRVEGMLPQEHAWRDLKGQRVEVRLLVEDADLFIQQQVFEGRVVAVDPRIVGGMFDVVAEIQNREDLLRPGLSAEVRIFLDEPPLSSPQAGLSKDNPETHSPDRPSGAIAVPSVPPASEL